MSERMLLVGGFISHSNGKHGDYDREQIEKTVYCLGSDTDAACEESNDTLQDNKADDNDKSKSGCPFSR